MKKSELSVEIAFTTPLCGSLPGNKEVTAEFIASRAPTQVQTDEEVESVPEMLEKGTTCFARGEKGRGAGSRSRCWSPATRKANSRA